jgi:hypothetical protein
MQSRSRMTLLRLSPLLLVTAAAGFWFDEVQQGGPYVLRNLLPPAVMMFLAAVTLWRGGGNWSGTGWSWPLGTAGFAIPALGLSSYLHYAYSVNLNDMFTASEQPAQLFRFLPAYTLVAGAIGFSIGWIVGRSV